MNHPSLDISKLTVDERLRLIDELWDSLTAGPDDVAMTEAQRDELDRRLDALDAERGSPGIPWDEVVRRIDASGT